MAYGYAVYFTERKKGRVVRWDPDSAEVDVVAGEPKDGEPSQKLSEPYGLVFDQDGFLLIADKLNDRIVRLKNGRLDPIPVVDVDGHRAPLPDTFRGYSPNPICPTGLFAERLGNILCSFADDYTVYRIHRNSRLEHLLGIVKNRNYHFTGTREVVSAKDVRDTPIEVPVGIVSRSDGTIYFIERVPQIVREFHPLRGLKCVFPLSRAFEWSRKSKAPDRAQIQDYHPGIPSSLALDLSENLFLTDILHGCVMRIDLAAKEVRKVLQMWQDGESKAGGPAALAFGPDGTAWVLDSAAHTVRAFSPTSRGPWKERPVRLDSIKGEPLELPISGSGIALGN